MAPVYIGLFTGAICYLALGIKKAAKLDDSLDVIAVHLVGGLVGSLLLGFFADAAINPAVVDEGVFLGGGTALLMDQLLASVVTIGFSFVASIIIGKVIDLTMGLRVTEEAEDEGLDLSQHAEVAYAD
jgi:ammonium transporter, Amt family